MSFSYTKNLYEYFHQSNQFYYFIADEKGNFIYLNPHFQKVLTYIPIDFSRLSIRDIFKDDADRYFEAANGCFGKSNHTISADLKLRTNRGNVISIQWEISPCENNKERCLQAIGIAIDYDVISEYELPEKFKAYEHSAEGLWLCILKEPISINANTEDIIAHCRRHAVFVECNENLAKMHGYEKPEELIGSSLNDLIDFDDPVRLEFLKNFIRNGFEMSRVETKEVDRNGKILYAINNMEGIIEDGLLKRVWGTQQDITEQKLAEEKIKHLASLVEVVSDIIISKDKDFNIVSWNKAAEQVFGYTAKEVIGKKVADFVKVKFQRASREEVLNTVLTEGVWKGEAYVTNRFGRHITILVSLTKITDDKGAIIGFVNVSKDITERKKFEEKLMQQEIQRQKQLTQATIDGQERERLEIGKELHDNISQHLTITRLYLEVIKDKKPEEIYEIINHAHKNLLGIINQIRHLSQSLVPPTLGDIGLIESVQEICDSLKKTHTFNIEFYHRHFTEETFPDKLKLMLYRIIQEQVNNILRHAQANTIQIRLESDAEHIILTITDNGKGFDIANYKKGLGLVNIRNRAGLFNGKVDIDSFPGKGCSLTVAIPCAEVDFHEMN